MLASNQSSRRTPTISLAHLAHGMREVTGTVPIAAPVGTTYAVLVDYENFHTFIADSSCTILTRSPLTVRMTQLRNFLGLTMSLDLVLAVDENAHARYVAMTFVSGFGVQDYCAKFNVEGVGSESVLRAAVASKPIVHVPYFLMDGIMRGIVKRTLEQIGEESARRAKNAKKRNLAMFGNVF